MGWTGSPPNQVFTRTDGTRTGTEVWQEAEGAGVNIISSDHDVHDQDQGDGINACLKKDGGNQPSANIPFNSKKITGFAQGSDRTDSIRIDQVQDGDLIYASVGGSADAIELTTSPTCSPVEGMSIVFIAGSDNTGAVTVDLNGNGAEAVQWLGSALSGGEIKSGQAHRITYDGTQWQIENPSLLGRLASTSNALGASLIGVEDDAGNFDATDVEAALAEIMSNLASNATDLGASLVGIEDSAGNFAATDVEAALAEIISDLASNANGNGASLVGIEDSGGIITATTVEGALAEIQTDLDAVEADYLTSSDILDEDDFSSDSADKAPSQQSTKAYINSTAVFTQSFESAGQTISNDSLVSVSHGLGEVPKLVEIHLRCTTAEHGYSVGDRIKIEHEASDFSSGTFDAGFVYKFNDTSVAVRFSSDPIRAFDWDTGSRQGLSNSNWELIIRAYA